MALFNRNTNFEGVVIKTLQMLHFETGTRVSLKNDTSSYAIVTINFIVFVLSLFVLGKATGLSCLIALCNIVKNLFVFHRDNKVLAEQHYDDTGNYPDKFMKSPYDYLLSASRLTIGVLLFLGICSIIFICTDVPDSVTFFGWVVGVNMVLTYVNTAILDISKLFRSKPVFKR